MLVTSTHLLQGIIFAYDVTRRETFEAIQGTWMKEVAEHANIEHAVKMVVANKIDRDSEREVSRKEGAAFANSQKCLFVETSAKANTAVTQVWDRFDDVHFHLGCCDFPPACLLRFNGIAADTERQGGSSANVRHHPTWLNAGL